MKKNTLILLVVTIIVIGFVTFVFTKTEEQEKKLDTSKRIKNILSSMSLQDKIGQMVLIEKSAITLDDIGRKSIGGVLSGGGGNPAVNSPEEWYKMVEEFQKAAMNSKLEIPLLYGVDAVHGHGNLKGAVIFPHNIGLGATRNAELVKRVAFATAQELKASGANWNFAPVLSLPGDLRWGRVYECFSTDVRVVTELGRSYISATQEQGVIATPKHFIGEGAENWETSKEYFLDQGDITMSIEEIKEAYLLPFTEAINAGAMSIMVSRSSINGDKISGNKYLLSDLLKNELGFKGFLVSDWGGSGPNIWRLLQRHRHFDQCWHGYGYASRRL